jgi:hypothetical protein
MAASVIPLPIVNAKTLDFTKPGAGAAGYGWVVDNVGAGLTKLYGARTQEDGGSKTIWEKMVQNTDASLARSPNSAVSRQFKQFLDTGKFPAAPSAHFLKYALESLDVGLREVARSQQHKQGFLDSFLGKLLVTAAQVGASFLPGGQFIAAGIGAAVGSMNGGGVFGAIKGGLSGYGIGKGAQWIANGGLTGAVNAITAPANGAGITATGGGGFAAIANGATNIATGIASGAALPGIQAFGGLVTGIASNAGGVAGPVVPRRDGTANPAASGGAGAGTPRATLPDPDREAAANAGKARIAASRLGRTNSWIIDQRGGRGDPRRLPNRRPMARSASVIPIADYTPTGRPVATSTVRNGQTTIQMVA